MMSSVTIEIVLIILLVLVNGLLAMSELAIISARKARLHRRAEHGDAGARAALELASAPNRFLSTVQVGITLVGILAGAFGGATLAEQLGDMLGRIPPLASYGEAIGIGAVVLAITYLSLVLGELVPKRLALGNAERIASIVARPMRVLSAVASPVVRLLSFSTEVVLRALGAKQSDEPPVTEDEIKMMIEQGIQAHVFEEAEYDLIENIFWLGDRRIKSLMTPRYEITWLDLEDPTEKVYRELVESGHSRIPVCQGELDKVLGIARAKDVLARLLSGEPADLKAILRPPLFVPENMPVLKMLEMFKQSGTHVALVTDEYGGIEGLVTHHDVLEAIVGEIPTIEEPAEAKAVRREDGSWLLDGTLPISDFKDIFQIKNLPGEERGTYQTLGGFVMVRMGRIPAAGQNFEWNELRFEVVDMDGRRVDKVLVTPNGTESATASNRFE
jgi:putative hemolysin